MQTSGLLVRSCSQILRTRQPFFRRVRVTSLSRVLLRENFRLQNARLVAGLLGCFGHPCQKQPSTKTTSRCLRNVKSGFPKMGRCRRHPVILFCRRRMASAISVALLPRPRMRDMTSERFAFVKTSGICTLTKGGGKFQSPLRFIRHVNEHPVVKPRPLRVTRIQFIVRKLPRVGAPPCLGGKTSQHGWPAAVRVFKAVGMQAWEKIRDRAPRADEGAFGELFDRAGKGKPHLTACFMH